MPDAKLPVIYAPLWKDGTLVIHRGAVPCVTESASIMPQRFAEYEPAVPRCKTCGYSGTTNGVRECHESKPPRLIRQDGEGYCDEHTEARR